MQKLFSQNNYKSINLKYKSKLKRMIKELTDCSPKYNWALQEDESVIYYSSRSYSILIKKKNNDYIKKIFCRNIDAKKSYKKEVLAQKIFIFEDWITKIEKYGKTLLGQPYFLCKKHPFESRVDRLAPNLSSQERFEVGLSALSIVLDLHSHRVAHRDFHARNLFYYDKKILIIDFETMEPYPNEYTPKFSECYDLIGQGMASPYLTKNMGFFKEHEYSVYGVLRVPSELLLPSLKEKVSRDFERVVSKSDDMSKKKDNNFVYLLPEESAVINNEGSPSIESGVSFYDILQRITKRRVLLIGDHYVKLFSEIINKSPEEVVFFEPSGETVREVRRFSSINDYHNVSVQKGGLRELIQSNHILKPFDIIFTRSIPVATETSIFKTLKAFSLVNSSVDIN